ncbi:MAG: chaperonin GroEL [Myxococcaceae bacterium]|nr:chaperonin GroEL [Myxococcaceae bacterium]
MTARELHFRSEAREKLLKGAQQLADAVSLTLGPRSRAVLIEKKWGRPHVCDDGVTIAKEVALKDPQENMGVQMLREPAERTQSEVGDGTTTATLLAHAIFGEGVRNIVAGANAVDLKRGIEQASQRAIEAFKGLARPVQSKKEKAQVATISAHGNTWVGELVADAIEKVGSEGVITVEEAKGTQTQLEVVEGMQVDNGYLSAYFVTDAEKMECVLTDAHVLFYDKKISTMKPLLPLLEQVVQKNAALLIVAEDVEAEALATLVVNKVRGALRCVAVKAPGFGDRRKAMLEDMAVLTGGQVIAEELGVLLEDAKFEQLGRVQRVVVTKDHTTLVGGAGVKANITARVENIRKEWQRSTSDYDKEKLQERIARLSGGVAVVRVGAASEAELKNRKDAFDDAVSATRAAIAEGIVPGAGLAFLRAVGPVLELEKTLEGDLKTGARIVRTALEVITRTIAQNSGADGGVVVDKMKSGSGNFGFNAATGQYGDLVEMGVIDPVKVLRLALENAVSSASTLLLTEATLVEVPEPKAKAGPPGAPNGDDY